MKKKRTTKEMANLLGEAWGNNRGEEFTQLFSEDAVIKHPFFPEEVSPKTIVNILNCNVKGVSEYVGYEHISGAGEGVDDVIKMSFIDTGFNCGYVPKYQGKMIITAYIKEFEFTRFEVFGYEIVESENKGKTFSHIEGIEVEKAQDLAELAGVAWESNNMDLFTSLFSKDAKIYHPLFQEPVNPYLVSDVLNSPMEGISNLKNISIISGTGEADDDIIDMYFEETGVQLGYLPEEMGILHMTAKIKNKRFTEFIVHSYSSTENKFAQLKDAIIQEKREVQVGMMQTTKVEQYEDSE
ncbi:hypothetical protein [Candidatus Enterococcus ikei]|uniref:Uncharacterized protein n=1 Tax=Candidatus Enterococcus ikei TaxID=2815326 RepID=A0ABS3GVI6_9ENTE|nr:hypothetical protein [Enterococcus sp. DIV0869a]MBO0439019.1 hypothetical protein [Enterococcus sp. DIV0869a]